MQSEWIEFWVKPVGTDAAEDMRVVLIAPSEHITDATADAIGKLAAGDGELLLTRRVRASDVKHPEV